MKMAGIRVAENGGNFGKWRDLGSREMARKSVPMDACICVPCGAAGDSHLERESGAELVPISVLVTFQPNAEFWAEPEFCEGLIALFDPWPSAEGGLKLAACLRGGGGVQNAKRSSMRE